MSGDEIVLLIAPYKFHWQEKKNFLFMMVTKGSGKNGQVCTISSKMAAQKKVEAQPKFWHIDRAMLPFKLHFFLFIGALGTALPYITIFGKSRIGITASSQAAILTAQMFLFIFTKPVIGYIADYFNKLKATICILSILQTIFFFLILLIPKIDKGDEQAPSNITHFINSNSSTLYLNCPLNKEHTLSADAVLHMSIDEEIEFCFISLDYLSTSSDECPEQDLEAGNVTEIQFLNGDAEYSLFTKSQGNTSSTYPLYYKLLPSCEVCNKYFKSIDCEFPKYNQSQITVKKKGKIVSDFETYQFWLYAILTTVGMSAANGIFTLSDTACCEGVEKTGAQFGRQRLFGAVGWGSMSAIGGLLNDYTQDFTAAWILMSAMSILSLLNMLRLDLVKPTFSKNILKDIGTVLKSKEVLAFKFCVFLNGIGSSIVWYYLVWYLTTIGGSRFLCGMVHFIQCFVGELPFMFFSGWFIKKIGHFNILTLALMSYCIRFFWYSRLQNPWLALPIEVLHAFTYAIFYPNVASYAKLSAKPGTEATTQALLFAAHEGLGSSIGCVVAGVGFDVLGGHMTFLYMGIFAGCGMILSIILHLCIRRQKGSVNVTSHQNA